MCQSFGILNCSRNIWPKSFFYSRLDIVVTLHGKSPFFFPDVMKRCSFQKHCAGIWFFLYYRKRWKLKMTFLKKNTRKYDIFFKLSEKSVFSKGAALGHDLSCIILNNGIFSRKNDIFSLGTKWEMTFLKKYIETWYFLCIPTGVTNVASRPSVKKNQKWSYSAKIHLKVIDVLDWHPRKSSSNSLYFHGDPSRIVQAFSCIALQWEKLNI